MPRQTRFSLFFNQYPVGTAFWTVQRKTKTLTNLEKVNIDIDVSDEGLKRPLSDDILLFSEALIQSSAETKQLYSDHLTHGVSYLQNELDSIQSLKDKVQAMSLEKALDEKAEVNSQDSDDKVRI